jgi:hypothetical protein
MRGAKVVEAPGFNPPKLKDTPPNVKFAVNAREERMMKMLRAYAKKPTISLFSRVRGNNPQPEIQRWAAYSESSCGILE